MPIFFPCRARILRPYTKRRKLRTRTKFSIHTQGHVSSKHLEAIREDDSCRPAFNRHNRRSPASVVVHLSEASFGIEGAGPLGLFDMSLRTPPREAAPDSSTS